MNEMSELDEMWVLITLSPALERWKQEVPGAHCPDSLLPGAPWQASLTYLVSTKPVSLK